MRMRNTDVFNEPDFKRCVDFHGHTCPGLAIGFQGARLLMRHAGVTRASDEELIAVVENDACGVDAIQVMTGCTFGKSNLIFRNYGKQAFSLGDRESGAMVRVSLRPDAIIRDPEYAALRERMQCGTASRQERERFGHLHRDQARQVLETDPGVLFDLRDVLSDMPRQARSVDSRLCETCGEPAKADLLMEIDGRMVCSACAARIRGKAGS